MKRMVRDTRGERSVAAWWLRAAAMTWGSGAPSGGDGGDELVRGRIEWGAGRCRR